MRERLYNIDEIDLSFLSVFIQNFINKKVYHLRTDDGQAISHWIESFSRNPDQAAVRERKGERESDHRRVRVRRKGNEMMQRKREKRKPSCVHTHINILFF